MSVLPGIILYNEECELVAGTVGEFEVGPLPVGRHVEGIHVHSLNMLAASSARTVRF